MKNKLLHYLPCFFAISLIIVVTGAGYIYIGSFFELVNFFDSTGKSSISGSAIEHNQADRITKQTNTPHADNSRKYVKKSIKPNSSKKTDEDYSPPLKTAALPENQLQDKEELDKDFEQFLKENGIDYETEKNWLSDRAEEYRKKPGKALKRSYSEGEKQIINTYHVKDTKLTDNGEVWIKIDPDKTNTSSIEKMMSAAAELYSDGTEPVKVVVWEDSRPKEVRTFFGAPIF